MYTLKVRNLCFACRSESASPARKEKKKKSKKHKRDG